MVVASTWRVGSGPGGGVGSLRSIGLNGAGKLSMPGTSTWPRLSEEPNTLGDSWRTISSSGNSSRPLTMRSFTSAGVTAITAAGNWSATSSHATCTTPSPSCGTISVCATSKASGSRNRAPSCGSGTRKAPGGNCPTTRSKGMRITIDDAADFDVSGTGDGALSTGVTGEETLSTGFTGAGGTAAEAETGSSRTTVTGGSATSSIL